MASRQTSDLQAGWPRPLENKVDDQAKFRNQVRDVLAHLYDKAYLERHTLVSQLLEPGASTRVTRAEMLRDLLKQTIDALCPQRGDPSCAPEWRSYLALHSLYIKGESFLAVQDDLGISRRQLQREVRKGLDALAAILWDRRVQEADPRPLSTMAATTEVQSLRQQLADWKIERQACDIRTLIDDMRWLLGPLMEQCDTSMRVDLPALLPPVFIDPTLTRQILFRILRTTILDTMGGDVTLGAQAGDKTVNIVVKGTKARIPRDNSDWEIASLLADRQGSRLVQVSPADGATQSVLSLPVVSRARVLVIDDVEAAHRLFERYLSPHNYEVVGTRNGAQAIELALDLAPDLMILDVMMPVVDGWQVLRSLQENPVVAEIPVIVCSVLDEPELALSLGARAYIKKPVNRLELLSTLERIRDASIADAAAHPAETVDH